MKSVRKILPGVLLAASLTTSPGLIAQASMEITPDYLAGDWCYSYYMAGEKRVDKNINYVFGNDGSLLYQNNSRTRVYIEGSYTLTGGTIKILPTHMAFTFRPQTVSQDELVLSGMGVHYWTRGACS
mgnify:CR=1 FL=1